MKVALHRMPQHFAFARDDIRAHQARSRRQSGAVSTAATAVARLTAPGSHFGWEARQTRANNGRRRPMLAPVVAEIQASGARSLRAHAAGLNDTRPSAHRRAQDNGRPAQWSVARAVAGRVPQHHVSFRKKPQLQRQSSVPLSGRPTRGVRSTHARPDARGGRCPRLRDQPVLRGRGGIDLAQTLAKGHPRSATPRANGGPKS